MSQNGSNEKSRGVPYADLPEASPDQPLAQEWNTYRKQVGRLLAEGLAGKHVLIKGNDLVGTFETFDAALAAGVQRFLLGPFLVHEIREEEPNLRIRGVNLPWPNLRSR